MYSNSSFKQVYFIKLKYILFFSYDFFDLTKFLR